MSNISDDRYDKKANFNKDNISVSVFIDSKEGYGCFEFEIEQTEEEKEMFGEQESDYAEGMLKFEDNELIDYDGVGELPEEVINLIHQLGYNTNEI